MKYPMSRGYRRFFLAMVVITAFSFLSIALISKFPERAPNPRPARRLPPPASAAQPRLAESYGKLPLSFEMNRGQTDTRVNFLSRGPGYSLFLTSKEAVFRLNYGVADRRGLARKSIIADYKQKGRFDIQRAATTPQLLQGLHSLVRVPEAPAATHPDAYAPAVLRMQLVGANPAAKVSGVEELPGRSNYFIGNDPKKWRTNVPSYAKVKYENVYPGIDLVYYGNQRQLEYDFVVQPGANPRQITLNIQSESAASKKPAPRVNAQGDLVVDSKGGEVIFQKPVVYQLAKGNGLPRTEILDGKYVIKEHEQVNFEVASYDRNRSLVIDPVLAYSTYLGGSGDEFGLGIAVDSQGNAYVTGQTDSSDFLATQGSLDTSCGTDGQCNPYEQNGVLYAPDVFVSKLSAAGDSLVYSTFLGGNKIDIGRGIAVDTVGTVYVTGTTSSIDFPVLNPLPAPNDTFQRGGAFVAKLNAAGNALVYSTSLGNAVPTSIAVDDQGNASVTGGTDSSSFPTLNPLPPPNVSQADSVFVTKLGFSDSKLRLIYSTHLGGSSLEYASGIAVDRAGNAYVIGSTLSTDFPTENPLPAPNNALQGSWDVFVSKLRFSGSTLSLAYSTFLGGHENSYRSHYGSEVGYAIAVDSSGDAYVTGATSSSDFPIVNPLPPPNNTLQGGFGAFVSKLTFSGSTLKLAYSTYLDLNSTGIAADSAGTAYVSGYGCMRKLIFTGSALRSDFSFCLGSALLRAIAVDSSGNAYVTGNTISPEFPTVHPLPPPNNALQGGQDAFVAKISTESANRPPVANAGPDRIIECASHTGTPVTLNGSGSNDPDGDQLTYEWKNSARQVIGSTAVIRLELPLGTYTTTLTVSDGKGGTASDQVVVTIRDTTPPSFAVSLSPNVLWPPDHQLVPIAAGIGVSDVCDANPRITLVSITSNEPGANQDVENAAFGTDDRNFLLRAERNGPGTGRTYTVRYRATDASGNSTVAGGAVLVPHDQR
jgi:hypothetical protein